MIDHEWSEWIEQRLSARPVPPDPPEPEHFAAELGDHLLNPDMHPVLPLKPAAVLVPFIVRPDQLTLLFTQRTSHLAHHPGQVSFPGGHIEPQDEGPEATALRETEEEIGLDRRHVRVIGRLDTYITRTGFIVTPVAAVVTPPFEVRPDPQEVAEIFEVPLSFILDRHNHQQCSAEFEGATRYFWAIPYGRHYIWGATAGMLINLCDIIGSR